VKLEAGKQAPGVRDLGILLPHVEAREEHIYTPSFGLSHKTLNVSPPT
jgi:hypothetical protein